MPGTKRNLAQRAKHRQRIAELRLKGTTIAEIVRSLRLSESTVHREIRSLNAEWKASAAASIDEHRARELRKLELVEQAAWKEYERSRKDYTKKTAEDVEIKGRDGEGPTVLPGTKHKVETGGRLGDPRLLQIALNAGEARRKILGLDAPTKVAPTDPTGEKPYQAMGDDELTRRIAELQAKLAA